MIRFVERNNEIEKWIGKINYISTTKGGEPGWFDDGISVSISVYPYNNDFEIKFHISLKINTSIHFTP